MISELIESAVARLAARRPLVLSGLRGGGKAWLVGSLADRLQPPLVVVGESHERAEELQHDLAYFAGAGRVFHFPCWDTVPYDSFSPSKEVVAQRMTALLALREGRCPILVTNVQALMQGMIPPALLGSLSFTLRAGETYPRRALIQRLVEAGYARVDLVEAPGEFSARGEIVDVFPAQAGHPFRLDFFGDELETLRQFEVDTQKSFRDSEEATVLPAGEAVVNAATSARALAALPDYKTRVQPEIYRQIYGYLEQGSTFPGVEQMLPLLYGAPGRLHEVLGPETVLLLDEPEKLRQRSHDFFSEVLREHELGLEQGNLVPPPESFFLTPDEFDKMIGGFYSARLVELAVDGGPDTLVCPFADNSTLRSAAAEGGKSAHATLSRIVEGLREWQQGGAPIFLAARSATGVFAQPPCAAPARASAAEISAPVASARST